LQKIGALKQVLESQRETAAAAAAAAGEAMTAEETPLAVMAATDFRSRGYGLRLKISVINLMIMNIRIIIE
jgi:hypothetical protein